MWSNEMFFKMGENNFYLLSKYCSLFHFVFKFYFQRLTIKQVLKSFKNSFLLLKTKKIVLKLHDQTDS